MAERIQAMILTDKRFWKFEAFTILYAGVLMLIELTIFGKSLTSEMVLFTIGWCCITSAITWPLVNGKHWFAFGLIYEVIFIILLFAYLMIDGLIRGLLNWLDYLEMCVAFVFPIAVVCFIPSMILAFVGYHLFNKNITNTKKL